MADPLTLTALLGMAAKGLARGTGSQSSAGTGSGTTGFDRRQLPLLMEALAQSDRAQGVAQRDIAGGAATRRRRLQDALRRQLDALQGFGDQELADIDRREQAQFGAVGQRLANQGLYNTTARQGMEALARREANIARGRARQRQQQVIGGALGQQAQMLDRADATEQQLMANLANTRYGMQNLFGENVARSARRNTSTERAKERSGLFGIF